MVAVGSRARRRRWICAQSPRHSAAKQSHPNTTARHCRHCHLAELWILVRDVMLKWGYRRILVPLISVVFLICWTVCFWLFVVRALDSDGPVCSTRSSESSWWWWTGVQYYSSESSFPSLFFPTWNRLHIESPHYATTRVLPISIFKPGLRVVSSYNFKNVSKRWQTCSKITIQNM